MCCTEIPVHACGHPALPPAVPVYNRCADFLVLGWCGDTIIEPKFVTPPTCCCECILPVMMAFSPFDSINDPFPPGEEACDAALSDESEAADATLSTDDKVVAKLPKLSLKGKVRKPFKKAGSSESAPAMLSDQDTDFAPSRVTAKQGKRRARKLTERTRLASSRSESEGDSDYESLPPRAPARKRLRTATGPKSGIPKLSEPLSTMESLAPPKDIRTWIHRPVSNRQIHQATRSAKGKNATPRPCNPFMLYRETYLARAKEFCSGCSDNQILSKVMGSSWALESANVKQQFATLAATEKVEHAKAFPGYVFLPSRDGGHPQTPSGRYLKLARLARQEEQEQKLQSDFHDASGYIDQVKIRLGADSKLYRSFLNTLRDVKSQTLDKHTATERVSYLFRDHPVLIQGFSAFFSPR